MGIRDHAPPDLGGNMVPVRPIIEAFQHLDRPGQVLVETPIAMRPFLV
jgi:hypothetical protein